MLEKINLPSDWETQALVFGTNEIGEVLYEKEYGVIALSPHGDSSFVQIEGWSWKDPLFELAQGE